MVIDHVVLWVSDMDRSVEFYSRVLGCEPLRLDEFRAGTAPFVSMRISDDTIFDLMPSALADFVRHATGEPGPPAAGTPTNHVCLCVSVEELDTLRQRLEDADSPIRTTDTPSFGARGYTDRWFYFTDPDGNVLEARAYAS